MNTRRGFTLVELMVVITIIAVLTGLLLPAVQKVREVSRMTVSRNNLRQIVLGANNYLSEKGVYPSTQDFSMQWITNGPPHPAYSGYTGGTFFSMLPYIGEDNGWRLTEGPPSYQILGSVNVGFESTYPFPPPPPTGSGVNPAASYFYPPNNTYVCPTNCALLNPLLPQVVYQSWKYSPTPVKTFIAPLDPSVPDILDLTMTTDVKPNPVSYLWNGISGVFVPEDLNKGTSQTIMLIEGYAYCGPTTMTFGQTPGVVVRGGWNLDSRFLIPWTMINDSVNPFTLTYTSPIDTFLYGPWDIKPPVWNCNQSKPQSFVKTGAIQFALYDGSVRTLTPDQENTDDLLGFLGLNNNSAAPPEIDW